MASQLHLELRQELISMIKTEGGEAERVVNSVSCGALNLCVHVTVVPYRLAGGTAPGKTPVGEELECKNPTSVDCSGVVWLTLVARPRKSMRVSSDMLLPVRAASNDKVVCRRVQPQLME